MKEKCKNLPRLGFPTSSDNLILETDASNNHWGAVLKTDLENICRYSSGTFKPAEKNYHSNEKELLAIKNGIAKFTFFSLPKKFKVRSNNTQVNGFILITLRLMDLYLINYLIPNYSKFILIQIYSDFRQKNKRHLSYFL